MARMTSDTRFRSAASALRLRWMNWDMPRTLSVAMQGVRDTRSRNLRRGSKKNSSDSEGSSALLRAADRAFDGHRGALGRADGPGRSDAARAHVLRAMDRTIAD